MDAGTLLQWIALAGAIVSVGSVLRQRDTIKVLKDNNEALEQSVKILKEETKACDKNHKVNEKKLTELQSQLDVYKELTLVPKDLVTQLLAKDDQIISMLEKR